MKLYVGGAWQNKFEYVSSKFENKPTTVDGRSCMKEDMADADIINHFHEFVYRHMDESGYFDGFVDWLYSVNPDVAVISDEVGSGIVPMDKKMRDYREYAGRILCELAKKSDEMERITCGIGMRIK